MSRPILYELVSHKSRPGPTFSPACWTTKLDLAFLGVEYTRQPITFAQLRGDLARQSGNEKVTLPTILDGNYITDSWTIAERYGERVFGDKKYARFMECLKPSIQEVLRPLVMTKIYESLDEESAVYFRNTKIGPATLDKWIDVEKNHFDEQCRLARHAMQPLERMLRQSEYLGETISHADFIIFGVYAWSKMSPRAVEQTWEHEEMPGLKRWIGRIMESGLVRKEHLP